ncbi:MAG: hypothetical protein QMD23_06020 [Candidatus Bathyarchaeia archaeon]|nr:hypothetical protein [Candidatus Bathyarchaeia archaeon]
MVNFARNRDDNRGESSSLQYVALQSFGKKVVFNIAALLGSKYVQLVGVGFEPMRARKFVAAGVRHFITSFFNLSLKNDLGENLLVLLVVAS